MPFLMGETTVEDYLERSKFSMQGRNRFAGAPEFYDYLASSYQATIFWSFIPEKCYFDKQCLAIWLKPAILAVNVYYFFIRKNCFMQCIYNLVNFMNPTKYKMTEEKQVKKTIEILIIGYVAGLILMPGAHVQF